MREDGEAAPLLRGRPAGGQQEAGPSSAQQRAGVGEDCDHAGDRSRFVSRRLPSSALLTRARSHPLLLAVAAVAAVAATVLVIGAGMRSTSEQGVGRGGGDMSLAAAPGSSGADAREEGRAALDLAGRGEGGVGGGGTGRGGSSSGASSGGWRSQAARAQGAAGGTAAADGGPSLASTTATGAGDAASTSTSTSKPNVFFFLIDDMGWGDIGYQSTDLAELTPNLDALAGGGVKLTSYYSLTLCTPARASIMTGRYPVRYGLQYAVILPGSPWGLPQDEKILPQYMNDAGYESHMVGKWHLGGHEEAALPSRRGFKSFLGYLNGIDTYYSHKNPEAEVDGKNFFDFGYGNATGYYDVSTPTQGVPCSYGPQHRVTWDEEGVHDARDPAEACYTGTYSTDAFVGRARQILKSKTPYDEEPLFLYMAHQAVHAPTGPAPPDGFTAEERELLAAVGETTGSDARTQFAGVLKFLDKRIGALVDMLEKDGWLENSVIVVASDNGACPSDGGTNYPLRGTKQSMYEGGSKIPAFVWSKSHLPSSVWGTSYDKMMHSTDWLPTLASLAGTELSGGAGALDGVDHWDSIKSSGETGDGDSSKDPRTEMLYNWDPYLMSSMDGLQENREMVQGAFRSGDWKLIVNAWCSGYYSHDARIIQSDSLLDPEVTCSGTGECQDCIDLCQFYEDTYDYGSRLYNLRDDPREEHDLYSQYPEIAKRLRERAEEVAYGDWTSSKLLPINTDSYSVWLDNDWWILPWSEKLQESKSKIAHNLNGLM